MQHPGTPSPPIRLTHPLFTGWAIGYHTVNIHDRATARSELGELFYQYRYKGATGNLGAIVETVADAVDRCFIKQGIVFDCMIVVPPSPARPEYQRVIELGAALARRLSLLSAQFAVAREDLPDVNGRPHASFAVPSENAGRLMNGRTVLVIDDIYRTGATVGALCRLLREEARVKDIRVLVGTATRR